MLEYFKNAHPEIIAELNETKALSDELGRKDPRCRQGVCKIGGLSWQVLERYRAECRVSRTR